MCVVHVIFVCVFVYVLSNVMCISRSWIVVSAVIKLQKCWEVSPKKLLAWLLHVCCILCDCVMCVHIKMFVSLFICLFVCECNLLHIRLLIQKITEVKLMMDQLMVVQSKSWLLKQPFWLLLLIAQQDWFVFMYVVVFVVDLCLVVDLCVVVCVVDLLLVC